MSIWWSLSSSAKILYDHDRSKQPLLKNILAGALEFKKWSTKLLFDNLDFALWHHHICTHPTWHHTTSFHLFSLKMSFANWLYYQSRQKHSLSASLLWWVLNKTKLVRVPILIVVNITITCWQTYHVNLSMYSKTNPQMSITLCQIHSNERHYMMYRISGSHTYNLDYHTCTDKSISVMNIHR